MSALWDVIAPKKRGWSSLSLTRSVQPNFGLSCYHSVHLSCVEWPHWPTDLLNPQLGRPFYVLVCLCVQWPSDNHSLCWFSNFALQWAASCLHVLGCGCTGPLLLHVSDICWQPNWLGKGQIEPLELFFVRLQLGVSCAASVNVLSLGECKTI